MESIRVRATLLGVLSALCLADPAFAYNINVHYRITELVAESCGVRHPKLIAWADARVDRDGKTRPEWPFNFRERATFHFRVTLGPPIPMAFNGYEVVVRDERVVRGSAEAAAIVDKAIAYEAPDPVLFGMGLHAYQDSWAHEGFEPVFGHLGELRYPDSPKRDPDKALEMSERTWEKMDAWSRATEGRACEKSWPELRDEVRALLASPALATDDGEFQPDVKLARAQNDFDYWADRLLHTEFVPLPE